MKRFSAVLLSITFILLIIAVNIFLIFPYFFQDFPLWISSIEVGFITMGRWISVNFGKSWWIPQWYGGIPINLLYAPVVPFLTAFIGKLIGNFGRGYHLVSGSFFVLVPVSLYFFVSKLTKSKFAGFVAAIFYSVAPTFGLFYPHVHTALFNKLSLWRLIILVYYGEGPHTASLFFSLLSAYFVLDFLEVKKYSKLIISSVFLALTGLSNPIGLFGCYILLTIIYFSWGVWKGEWKNVIIWIVLNFSLGLLFSSFWYNPSFILNDIAGEGSQVGSELLLYFPWRFLIFLGIILGIIFVVKKTISDFENGFTVLWFLALFFVLGTFYYFEITLIPQVRRFIIEFDLAGATLVAVILSNISKQIENKFKKPLLKNLKIIPFIMTLILSVFFVFNYQKTLDRFMNFGPFQNKIALSDLREYELANWMKENTQKTDRVFVSANYTYWLNYFTDVWQLRGSHFQSSINPWEPHAGYQITAGDDGLISMLWLKIFNLKYIVVNPVNSYIHYQDYLYPEKFEGLLTQVGTIQEDLIYEVNDLPGLSRQVDMNFDLTVPENGADKNALEKYLNWLSNGEILNTSLIKNDTYNIFGNIRSGNEVRIAISYDKSFRAVDNLGHKLKVKKDILGFILIDPEIEGNQTITLNYFPGFNVWIGVATSIASYISIFLYFILKKIRKNKNK